MPHSAMHRQQVRNSEDLATLASLIWAIVVLLVVLWLVGLVANIAGGLINILLIAAIVLVAYNLFVGRRRI